MEASELAESTDRHEEVVDLRKIAVRRQLCSFCEERVISPCSNAGESEFCERNAFSIMQVSPG